MSARSATTFFSPCCHKKLNVFTVKKKKEENQFGVGQKGPIEESINQVDVLYSLQR